MKLPESPGTSVAIAFARRTPDRAAVHSVARQPPPGSKDSWSKRPKWDKEERPRDTRPVCEHPTCRKRIGHSTENCFVRKRGAGDMARRRKEKSESVASPSRCRPGRKKYSSQDRDAHMSRIHPSHLGTPILTRSHFFVLLRISMKRLRILHFLYDGGPRHLLPVSGQGSFPSCIRRPCDKSDARTSSVRLWISRVGSRPTVDAS